MDNENPTSIHPSSSTLPNEASPLLMGSQTPPSPKRLHFKDEANAITILDESEEESANPISTNNAGSNHPFPPEYLKTVVVAVILAICFFLNTLSLVLTHQRQPDRNTTKPLPDIILDNLPFPVFDDGLYIAEVMIMFSTFSTIILMILHRFRWIVFRRVFFVMAILYLYRSITMYVTVFPEASYTYYCSPKFAEATVANILLGTLKVLSGFGLSINGEHTYCGDYMYSGHTVILVLAALIIQEYSPRISWHWKLVHGLYWIVAIAGILLVLSARAHYTIDILVAYYVTTRLWWIYHTLVNNLETRKAVETFINRSWWYRVFEWMEGNVREKLPHHYSIPFVKRYANFESSPPTFSRLPDIPKYR